MCEFVRYRPFSYNLVSTGSTSASYVRYSSFAEASVCTGTVTINDEAAGYITAGTVSTGVAIAGRTFGTTYCDGGDCMSGNAPASGSNEGFCRNDHSSLTSGIFTYPNTDTGSVELRTISCSVADETAGDCDCTGSVSVINCGGQTSNAIAGPINDVSGLDKSVNTAVIYPAFSSLNETVSISSPISNGLSANYRLANYTRNNACYGATSYHIEDSVALGATTLSDTWESFIDSNDPFGSSMLNKFYTLECLNASGDLKARIRLQVRDWDRTFIPETTGVQELAPATLMDDSTTSCFGSNCNNRNDFDDIIGTNFGTCGTSLALSAGTPTVDLVAGSFTITANTGTFSSALYRRGTKIVVGPGGAGNELHFVVESYVDNTTLIVTTPSPQSLTGQAIQYYDGYRFPLEGL